MTILYFIQIIFQTFMLVEKLPRIPII